MVMRVPPRCEARAVADRARASAASYGWKMLASSRNRRWSSLRSCGGPPRKTRDVSVEMRQRQPVDGTDVSKRAGQLMHMGRGPHRWHGSRS